MLLRSIIKKEKKKRKEKKEKKKRSIIWNQVVYVSSYGDGMAMVMPLCPVRV